MSKSARKCLIECLIRYTHAVLKQEKLESVIGTIAAAKVRETF